MQIAEIWLRMQKVNGLKTEVASRLVMQLAEQDGHIYRHLPACGLSEQQCSQFRHVDDGQLKATLHWLQQPDRHLLPYSDARFPPLLRQIPDAPLLLLVWGDYRVLHQPQIAMVGSRAFSHYGERWGQYFAAGLANCGLVITSGLAMGIDAICHRAALAVEGTTVAVLGSGLDNIYPHRHKPLAQQIRQQGGAIVSEHWVSDLPLPDHFPRRNRIISGLSQGVLVVEASLRSGSLITARYALEQGRDVFALPGPLGSPVSEGTHWLIQQGGYLVTEPKDIAEQLETGLQWLSLPQESTISCVEAEVELPFADVLANVGDEVTPIDVVAERVGQPVPEVVIKLLDLELAGWIAAVPGGYVRIRRPGHVRRTHVLV